MTEEKTLCRICGGTFNDRVLMRHIQSCLGAPKNSLHLRYHLRLWAEYREDMWLQLIIDRFGLPIQNAGYAGPARS